MKNENELWDYLEGQLDKEKQLKIEKLLSEDNELLQEFLLIKEVQTALKKDIVPELPHDFSDVTLARCLSVPIRKYEVFSPDSKVIFGLFTCLFIIFVTTFFYSFKFSIIATTKPVLEYDISSVTNYLPLMLVFSFSFFIGILLDGRFNRESLRAEVMP
ncbi:MAG: hypothetical protein ACTHZ7_03665 [Sphingobacterium sp.]